MLKNIAVTLFLTQNVILTGIMYIAIASTADDIETEVNGKVAIPTVCVLIANIVFAVIALLAKGG